MSTPPTPPALRIFVSHSHHDNTFCRPFVAHLRSALGLAGDAEAIFYDENSLHAGDAWLERIQREVLARPIFLVILSPQSVVADYVRQETNLALRETIKDHSRLVISLLIEECDPNTLAPLLGNYQRADFVHRRYEVAFDELLAVLRGTTAGDTSALAIPVVPALPLPPPDPRFAQAQRLADEVQVAMRQQRYADAYLRAQLALDIPGNENNAALRGDLALAYAGAGRWQQAREALQRALALDPFRFELWRTLAQAELQVGDFAAALAALDRAQAVAPLDDADLRAVVTADRRVLLAAWRAQLTGKEQWTEALAKLDDELALAPDDVALLDARLELLRHLNRSDEALALLQQLVARPDATAARWLALAEATSDQQERTRALDAAARLAPTDLTIAQARARLLPPLIPPQRFPQRLADLGFAGHSEGGVEYLTPPLCAVPAGPFLMGSDKRRDAQASANELPQHTVTLPAYAIARFPVTVAEYACFLPSGRTPPTTWPRQRGQLDHAVEDVSWNDAASYAVWLAQVTGQPWRLATEAEWEKAARGTDGRIYPWGDQWDGTRALVGKVFGGAAAVGSYPSGASPYGVQDLAGNVWEWTNSLFTPYPYSQSDGRENPHAPGKRVLRGGSWKDSSLNARAARRIDFDPVVVSLGGGFRLVLAAPGSV